MPPVPSLPFDLTGFHAFLGTVLPLAAGVLRLTMVAFGAAVLLRCVLSLFQERNGTELWGRLALPNGVQFELRHWENLVGRGRGADVVLDFPVVSRKHAALLRDDRGRWKLFPLGSKNGTTQNGVELAAPAEIFPGDLLSFGGLETRFYPVSAAEERDENRRLGVYKRKLSPHRTLLYLTIFQILLLLQTLIALPAEQLLQVAVCFGVLAGAMWGLYLVYRAFARTAFEAETLAFFLCSLSFGVTAAYSPRALRAQTLALLLGIVLFFVLSLLLRDLKAAVKLRWPVAIGAGILLVFNLLLGERIFGAKNWMSVGPFTFQPSEFIKIAFVLVGGATLDRLFSNRNLIFTTLFTGFCLGSLALMSDFGTALVFFAAFVVIAFLRSGNWGFLLMLGVGAALAGWMVLQFKPYALARFAAWGHVWDFSSVSGGYQQTRTLSAIASGGLFGKSADMVFLKNIGAANTDLVFGVVSEEFGLILAVCALLAIVALVLFTVKAAGAARSSFYTIAACTAAAMLAVQTGLNVFGAVDILPLTGITFPFLSAGGSSMIACWGLLSFLKAADTRRNASFTVKRPRFFKAKDPYRGHTPVDPRYDDFITPDWQEPDAALFEPEAEPETGPDGKDGGADA
jgi:cell division protein FtsW (lipid II flippase)